MDVVVYGFEGAEESAELRSAKFITEGGATDGAFDHDVEGAGHAAWMLGNGLLQGSV